MRVLGLPGRDRRTEVWMHELLAGLPAVHREVACYRHWSQPLEPDVRREAEQIARANLGIDLVVAKSLGTAVAVTVFSQGIVRPSHAIFIGTPWRGLAPSQIEQYRQFVRAIPTLFIQQTEDRHGPYDQLAQQWQDYPLAQVVAVIGNDHVYDDLSELLGIISPWLQGVRRDRKTDG